MANARRAYQEHVILDARSLLAREMFTASHFMPSEDSRFIMLVVAVEAMIEAGPRPSELLRGIEGVLKHVARLDISSGDRDILRQTIEGLRRESINAAGNRHVLALGDRKYMDQTPQRLFRDCYTARSELVHGNVSELTAKRGSHMLTAIEEKAPLMRIRTETTNDNPQGDAPKGRSAKGSKVHGSEAPKWQVEGSVIMDQRKRAAAARLEDAAEMARKNGELERSEQLLEQAAEFGGTTPGLLYNLGLVRSELGDHAGAIRTLTAIVPADYEAIALRGLSYDRIGERDRAREDYLRVLAERPEDVDTLVNLGTLELAEENIDAADRYLARALQLDETVSWQYAEVELARGNLVEARNLLEDALVLGERRAELDLALLDAADGRDSDADVRFRHAIEAGATLGRREYATFLLLHDRVAEALDVSGKGVRAGDDWSYAPYAIALERSGREREAEKYRALAVDVDDERYLDDGPAYVAAPK